MSLSNTKKAVVSMAALALSAAPIFAFAQDNSVNTSAHTEMAIHSHAGFRGPGWMGKMGRFIGSAVEGTVSSINNGLLTVTKTDGSQTSVQTTSSTSIKNGGKDTPLASISTGTMIAARGSWDSAHSILTATKIQIIPKLHPVRDWFANLMAAHVAGGSVTAISGSILTVTGTNGVVYTVNASSAKVYGKDGSTAKTLSDIKVNDKLQVMGTVSGTSVTAEIIHDLSI